MAKSERSSGASGAGEGRVAPRVRTASVGALGLALALGGIALPACGGGGGTSSRIAGSSGSAGTGAASLAPNPLTATAVGLRAIELAWTDNTSNELGFKIERREAGTQYIEVFVTAPDATTHRDAGVQPGTRYTYRVTAFGPSGALGTSDEVSATTFGEWTRQLGTPAADDARGVAVQGGGLASDVAVFVGSTAGDLGAGNAGGLDAYVEAVGFDGQRRWLRQIATAEDDVAAAAAVDPLTGDVIVCGFTKASLAGPNQGAYDAFVTRYTPDGLDVWTYQYGTVEQDYAIALAIDSAGNILVGGYHADPGHGSGQHPFVLKLTPQGTLTWQWTHIQFGNFSATSIAVDGPGNAYLLGRAQFGMTGTTVDHGGGDLYVVKLDPQGVRQWVTQLGSPPTNGHTGHDLPGGIAIGGPNDRIYVTGFVQGDAFGARNPYQGPATSSGNKWDHWGDLLIAEIDAQGTQLRAVQLGTASDDWARSLAVAPTGEVYVGGITKGAISGAPAGHQGGVDGFVMKLAPDLQVQWVHQFGSGADDFVQAVAVDGLGSIFTAGSTDGDLDGPLPGTHHGLRDAFLVHVID